MAAVKLATAFVEITSRGMGQLNREFGMVRSTLGGALASIARQAAGVFSGMQLFSLANQFNSFIEGAKEAVNAEQRLAAVIKATGGAAGFTAKQISEYTTELQEATGISGDLTNEAASKLLTFKSVVGETFKEALSLAQDLSATGFGSVDAAAVQLGKALEDPVKGLASLRRVGVTFTEEQQKQIKALMKANELFKAQRIVLDAVKGQVGGVARELGKTDFGRLAILQERLGDLGEEIGKKLIPIKNAWMEMQVFIRGAVLRILDSVALLIPKMQQLATAINDAFEEKPAQKAIAKATEELRIAWQNMVDAGVAAFARLQEAAGKFDASSTLSEAFAAAISGVSDFVLKSSAWFAALSKNWGATWEFMRMDALLQIVRVQDKVSGITNLIVGAFQIMAAKVQAIFGGMVEAIGNAFAKVFEMIDGIEKRLPQGVKDFLGITPADSSGDASLAEWGNSVRKEAELQLKAVKKLMKEAMSEGMSPDEKAIRKTMSELREILNESAGDMMDLDDPRRAPVRAPKVPGDEGKPGAGEMERGAPAISAGLSGFAEMSKKIQDAFLTTDPMKELVAIGKDHTKILGEDVKVGREIAAAIKNLPMQVIS